MRAVLQGAIDAGTDTANRCLPMNYEVLIVDDHPLFRAALRGAVAAACPNCQFLEADGIAGLFDALEQHPHADLLLLDLNLPGAHGFCTLAHLRGSRPELPVIVVSARDDHRTVRRALAFGAQGFVSKSADGGTIGRNVSSVLRGEYVAPAGLRANTAPAADAAALDLAEAMAQMTAQQFRVFGLLCSGRRNQEIADELKITETTVKAQMSAILRKLGAANRTQAVLLASQLLIDMHGIRLPPEDIE
jgi:DNA-binding NarL/FixJ family response regulator